MLVTWRKPGRDAAASLPPAALARWAFTRPSLVGTPLVIGGWDARPLADDTDPFGIDPEQTFGIN